jgi:protein transport protein DSL1/ZW10
MLRRDITAYYIDHLLTHPTSLAHSSTRDPSGISSQTLSLLPSPASIEDLSLHLKNVSSVLDFLDVHLFAALPPSHVASFKKTLCKPITTALLQRFLVSHLPSSLAALPPYLHLVGQAKELEEKYIVNMLGQDPRDRETEIWADAVSSHYERKRRAQILEDARQTILRQDEGLQIRIEVDLLNLPPTPLSSSVPATQSSGSEGAQDVSNDAWGLEEEESGDTDDMVSAAEEEDAWGFDDAPTEPHLATSGVPPEPILPGDTAGESEPAADDSAWGWDDEGEEANPPATTSPRASFSENSVDGDDDPWGESSKSSPPPSAPASAPKPASRLEKLASKAKAKATPPHSPSSVRDSPTAATRQPPPATAGQTGTKKGSLPRKQESPKPVVQPETYAVSGRAQKLADTVDGILREGEEFASTTIFDSKASAAQQQTRGSVILQTAPAVLDLFRALYPVGFGLRSTEPKSIVFANDCIYAHERALSAAQKCTVGAKDKLLETADSLEAMGKRWFEQSVVGVLVLDICCP